jgi:hypothetical protein
MSSVEYGKWLAAKMSPEEKAVLLAEGKSRPKVETGDDAPELKS